SGGLRRWVAHLGTEGPRSRLCRGGGPWYDWPTVRVPQRGCHAWRGGTAPRYQLPRVGRQPPGAGRLARGPASASCAAAVGWGLGTPTVHVPAALRPTPSGGGGRLFDLAGGVGSDCGGSWTWWQFDGGIARSADGHLDFAHLLALDPPLLAVDDDEVVVL